MHSLFSDDGSSLSMFCSYNMTECVIVHTTLWEDTKLHALPPPPQSTLHICTSSPLTYTPPPLTYTPSHPLQYTEEEKVHKQQQAQENFLALVQAEEADFVTNKEAFECPVCFADIEAGEGVTLRECLHQFCQ